MDKFITNLMAFLTDLLTTPDSQDGRPYSWGVNQVGHMLLGIVIVLLSVIVSHYFWGEIPHKETLAAFSMLSYLWFEISMQGWRGLDTVVDSMFTIVFGAWGVIWSCTEITPGMLDVQLDPTKSVYVFLLSFIVLVWGVIRRIKNYKR